MEETGTTRIIQREPGAGFWFWPAASCGLAEGDDYAAMRQAVSRRYAGLASGEGTAPDLILIDGGRGQVSSAFAALADLGLADLPMLGVAKGEERKPDRKSVV